MSDRRADRGFDSGLDQGPVVRAAGGVIWRPGPAGDRQVVLVHRPRYDDWTFPKGKADPGESDEDCARREVQEETGLRAVLGPPLVQTAYADRSGRAKIVRYWAMTVAVEEPFVPNHEVDELRWLGPADAGRLLTYARDQRVLAAFVGADLGGPATLLP